jgi:hypothetical protein
LLVSASVAILTTVAYSQESNTAYSRRSYQLGATISEVAAMDFPDEKDWPGAKLFFSSDRTFVWAANDWLPLADIRAAMHPSWKKSDYNDWVPIKDIQPILPFKFTAAELEGNSEPYRIDKNYHIKKVKEKDLEKYADVVQYQHPPQADLPSVTCYGSWADAGVIKGEFYYPKVDRTQRVDGKPWVTFSSAGLWLGDVWNKTTLYFYQPKSADEPILFYVETTGLSGDFERLKALFQQAYGAPTSQSENLLQNRMGATFGNEIVEYRNEVSSMILEKYGDDLNTGRLVHIHWPTYRSLEEKLNLKDNEAASKL